MTATQSRGRRPIPSQRSDPTRETAEKIAKDGATEGTDVARLLAGLIAHLADQMEKLAAGSLSAAPPIAGQGGEGSGTRIAERPKRKMSARRMHRQLRLGTPTRIGVALHECCKSLWASIQGDPVFMRALNGWLTIFWIRDDPQISIFTGWGILAASLTLRPCRFGRLFPEHWSAWQAARVESGTKRRKEDGGEA